MSAVMILSKISGGLLEAAIDGFVPFLIGEGRSETGEYHSETFGKDKKTLDDPLAGVRDHFRQALRVK